MKLSFVSPLIEGHSAVQPIKNSLPLPSSISNLKNLLKEHIQQGEFERAYYIDSENDLIALSDEEDLKEARIYYQ
jgi:hypothetical protein